MDKDGYKCHVFIAKFRMFADFIEHEIPTAVQCPHLQEIISVWLKKKKRLGQEIMIRIFASLLHPIEP